MHRTRIFLLALASITTACTEPPSSTASAGLRGCNLDCPDPPPDDGGGGGTGGGGGGGGPPVLNPIPLRAARSFKYVGFFGMQWGDTQGNSPTYNLDRTASYTNIAFENHDISLLRAARDRDVQVIVDTYDFFYTRDSNGVIGILPDSEIEARWPPFVAAIHANGLDGAIAAFYPIDEPYLDAATCNEVGYCSHAVPATTMRAWMEHVNARIKQDFPTTPIAVIFAAGDVMGDATQNTGYYFIPSGYDWVGFDIYDPASNYLAILDRLESAMSAIQRVIMVPPTSANIYAPSSPSPAGVASMLNAMTLRSNSDPKVIGLFGFTFQPLQVWTGIEALPDVLSSFTATGRSVSAPTVSSIEGGWSAGYFLLHGENFTSHCQVKIYPGGTWRVADAPLRVLSAGPELWCMSDTTLAITTSAFAGRPSANVTVVNSRNLTFGEFQLF